MELAYVAVGRAILAAQLFETALVPIFEMHRIHSEPDRLGKTGGYLAAGAFKVPIASIVRILAEKGTIAPDLETRLKAYVEDRHLLVHRWVQERGIPDDNNPKDFLLLAEFALRVEREARELARIFVGYILKYADPDWSAANQDEYKARMAQMFLRAHVDD